MFYQQIIGPFLSCLTKYSNRNAFCIDETFFSYNQFAETISKIRIAIRNSFFSNAKVGLVANDDMETYASIFALWLEGKAYIPLHPNWPLERTQDIVEQVKIDLILDSSDETRYINDIVLLTKPLKYSVDCLDYEDTVSDEELAYILFTSGSTGKPKGVMITRGNVAAFMYSFWQTEITISEEDRCLQCFDLTFDASVQGFLVPITKGACCYTVPHGQVKYIYISALIEDHKLTFGAIAPSMLRYLQPYFDELDAASLKCCLLIAEASPLSVMEDWYKCATNAELYDFYGPTEATIYCTYYKLDKGGINKTLNGIISIGKPFANVQAIIIDENCQVINDGEKGELCVAGDQITIGYWNNDVQNAKAFFEKEVDGKMFRFYHTGDLCFRDADGDIMYYGRLDHQAKIQGFRVELGEIEFHAREFLKDKNVVCIAFENKQQITEIVMFIESVEFNTDELLLYMRSKMPTYMIPSRTVFVPSFPLNSNEKTDKNKLKYLIYE